MKSRNSLTLIRCIELIVSIVGAVVIGMLIYDGAKDFSFVLKIVTMSIISFFSGSLYRSRKYKFENVLRLIVCTVCLCIWTLMGYTFGLNGLQLLIFASIEFTWTFWGQGSVSGWRRRVE